MQQAEMKMKKPSIDTSTSHARLTSASKYQHLRPKRSCSIFEFYNNKESYLKCLKSYFKEENLDFKKFKASLNKIKKLFDQTEEEGRGRRGLSEGVGTSVDVSGIVSGGGHGSEKVVELLGGLVEELDARRCLIEGLSLVLPPCFTIKLHAHAVVIKVGVFFLCCFFLKYLFIFHSKSFYVS